MAQGERLVDGKYGLLSFILHTFPTPCAVFVFAHLELVDAIVDRGRRRRPRVRYVYHLDAR